MKFYGHILISIFLLISSTYLSTYCTSTSTPASNINNDLVNKNKTTTTILTKTIDVPKSKNETIITKLLKSTSTTAQNAERRSYDDDNEQSTQSLFKSLIPKSIPFKKPIKKIFRSWFEPDPDALNDDSTSSTFYFTRSKTTNPLNTLRSTTAKVKDPMLTSASTRYGHKHGSYNYGQKYQPVRNSYQSYHQPLPPAQKQIAKASSRQLSIGDPSNGRGVTLSFGESPNEASPSSSSYHQTSSYYPTANYQQQPQQSSYSEGSSSGGGRGISFSFGGGDGQSSGGGPGGMSFNIGRGSGGRGMSFSFGRGGGAGGSGLSFSFGGGGGGYEQSGSQSYPSYSSSYSSGNGYGISYGSSNYNNYDYYQPVFSMVMPSNGKKVIEYNQHPPKMKMKINSSPKVKITTNTKDPLDKPGLDEEVIQEDIFGPPEPFEKPNKTATSMNETMPGSGNMTMMMGHFNQSMFPPMFPYPPYPSYMPYAHYYQYNPYNYYYQQYQQYYQQQQQQYPYNYYQYMMMNTNSNSSTTPSMMPTSHMMSTPTTQPQMQQMQPLPQPQVQPLPHPQPQSQLQPQPQIYSQQPQQQQRHSKYTSYPSYSQYAASAIDVQKTKPTNSYSMPVSASYSMAQSSPQQLSTIYGSTAVGGSSGGAIKPSSSSISASYITQPQWQPSSSSSSSSYGQKIYSQPSYYNYQSIDSGYKRSSASRNYQKDMLTLNSLPTNTKRTGKKLINSVKRNNPYKYYGYDLMQTSESKSYPYGMVPSWNYTMMGSQNHKNYLPGTGMGYSFFNNSTNKHYNGSHYWSYPYNTYYNNPYYYQQYYQQYQQYQQYYQYAKKYYEQYYAALLNATNGTNSTKLYNGGKYYPKNITSITGFSQNSFDYEQSKRFGSRMIKHQGGSTKEEKARVILDIRPRVTFKMLNKTEQALQDEELKKKKKDHIFKTHMEIIMDSTTTPKPKSYYSYYDSYYGYNYGPEVDDFGWTHEPPYGSSSTTTPKPSTTTTTRRRTTTTESPDSSSEVSEEEENGTSESTSAESSTEDENESSSTTSTTETPESGSEEEVGESDSGEQSSSTSTTSTSTTESTVSNEDDGEEEEEITGDEAEDNNSSSADNNNVDDDNVEEEEDGANEGITGNINTIIGNRIPDIIDRQPIIPATNNVTVSPELVQAMIKALQEALGVTTTTATPTTQNNDLDDEGFDEPNDIVDDIDDESEGELNDNVLTTSTTTMASTALQKMKSTPKPKTGIKGAVDTARRRLPTNVISTTVRNVTQLRLKTPVLSMQSRSTTLPLQRLSTTVRPPIKKKSMTTTTSLPMITTTSPLLIKNNQDDDVIDETDDTDKPKVIDGDALLNNFDINNLTDDERRDMLTNILNVIQQQGSSTVEKSSKKRSSSSLNSKKSTTTNSPVKKLLPVTKANNVRIISSLDELKDKSTSTSKDKSNQPIYVVLLPQKKKK